MKKNLLKISVLAIAILAIVSMIGLTVFAAETPEIIETKEITIESGNFDFYKQERVNASDATKNDYRIIAVMNEEWLLDVAFAEVQITFSNGTDSKTLTAVPQTVYETVYADTAEGRTVYTAAEGNIMLGWVVMAVPSDYTVTSATVDVTANITVEEAVAIAGALDGENQEKTTESYTVTGVVTAISSNNREVTITADGASIIAYASSTPENMYMGYTVTITGLLQNYYGKYEVTDYTVDEYVAATYSATVEDSENGTVNASKTEGIAWGEEITLTVAPADGYKLLTLKVNGIAVDVTDGVYTKVSNDNITVSAEFVTEATEVVETVKTTYDFSTVTGSVQYAANEQHILDERTTVTVTECHINKQLRIYSSSTHNGFAIIKSTTPIHSITMNAGNKADTLNVYASTDGETWTLIEGVAVTSSYKDVTVDLDPTAGYLYLKLDVKGTQQLRVANMTLTVEK